MRKPKKTTTKILKPSTLIKSGLAAVLGDALSEIVSLAEECREIVDNASEGLSQTQRIQTLDETASVLEGLSEPDVPEGVEIDVTYEPFRPRRRPYSRAARCGQACYMLGQCIDALEQLIENKKHAEGGDGKDDEILSVENLKDEIESVKSDAESVDFPGMYG